MAGLRCGLRVRVRMDALRRPDPGGHSRLRGHPGLGCKRRFFADPIFAWIGGTVSADVVRAGAVHAVLPGLSPSPAHRGGGQRGAAGGPGRPARVRPFHADFELSFVPESIFALAVFVRARTVEGRTMSAISLAALAATLLAAA